MIDEDLLEIRAAVRGDVHDLLNTASEEAGLNIRHPDDRMKHRPAPYHQENGVIADAFVDGAGEQALRAMVKPSRPVSRATAAKRQRNLDRFIDSLSLPPLAPDANGAELRERVLHRIGPCPKRWHNRPRHRHPSQGGCHREDKLMRPTDALHELTEPNRPWQNMASVSDLRADFSLRRRLAETLARAARCSVDAVVYGHGCNNSAGNGRASGALLCRADAAIGLRVDRTRPRTS